MSKMTDQEFERIMKLTDRGISERQACTSDAQRKAFQRLSQKKGFMRPKAVVVPRSVTAVIQEAARAANDVPSHSAIQPQPVPLSPSDIDDSPPPTIQEMYALAKKVVAKKLRDQVQNGYFSADCVRLSCIFFEKELPEWGPKNTKLVKDQYQSILEDIVKKSSGFTILERKEDHGNDNSGNASEPSKR